MTDIESRTAPVTSEARIESLDILRGIAVCGILMMNITAFGLFSQAYGNPLADGGATGLNLLAYKIINVGFEGTMRGLFSLLFGAGIILLTERMELAGAGLMTAEIHFRRMTWLLLAGIIHWALLLWFGEILFNYALCGMLLFAVRKLSFRWHLAMAAALLVGSVALSSMHLQHLIETEAAASAATEAKASGAQLTGAQEEAIDAWEDELGHAMPTRENAQEQRDWHAGSYWTAVTGQFETSYEFQWTDAPRWLLVDMLPFMLIGMALLKLGVLGAQLSATAYLLMMLVGYGIGLPLGFYEMSTIVDNDFSLLSRAAADATYQFSRLAMVTGHLGLALLLIRKGLFGGLQRRLAAVGQMALTNYLTQTLICTLLFYSFGIGLGLFGRLERHELYFVVLAIWIAQLIWSPLWLRRFRFGPFEWVWRSLTYWRRQPMRI